MMFENQMVGFCLRAIFSSNFPQNSQYAGWNIWQLECQQFWKKLGWVGLKMVFSMEPSANLSFSC